MSKLLNSWVTRGLYVCKEITQTKSLMNFLSTRIPCFAQVRKLKEIVSLKKSIIHNAEV